MTTIIIIKVNKIRQDTNKGMIKVLTLFDNWRWIIIIIIPYPKRNR